MDPDNKTAADTSVDNDAQEWEDTGLDFLTDHGIEPDKREEEQGALDESKKQQEDTEGEKTPEENREDEKSDEEPGNGDDTGKKAETDSTDAGAEGEPKPDTTEQEPTPEQQERNYRRTQLELEADRKELAKDVKEKMFSDQPTRLEDADGDPIETIQDVMRLQNPNTGKQFTAEEAAQWLLQAQRHFDKKQEEMNQQVDTIVDTNMSIKEEADQVREQYGELLTALPNLRAQIWNEYQKTLVRDENSDVITKAPVSLKAFYDTILTPYMKQAEKIKAETKAEEKRKAQEEAERKKKEQEQQKRQSHSDREDVFSTRTKLTEGMDPEEKEWADVAKEHFEG